MSLLQLAATLDFLAAALHLYVIWWGPDGYRFFGAGERLAQMAERKHPWPVIVTLLITGILIVWGLYCLTLDGLALPLPWVEPIMLIITAVYLIRGIYPLIMSPFVAFFRTPFMIWSTLICAGFGVVHLLAIRPWLPV